MISKTPELVFTPTDFVGVLNQTLEFAYPSVTIVGELANFRVSRGKWLYFDLKDEQSSVKFFGTVYNLTTPLEEGMIVRVTGYPKLHNLYGFSVTVQSIMAEGEGSLKKAQDLLAVKLEKEGIFAEERKRPLPYPPATVALIAAKESAAYADFIKILNARWTGVTVYHKEVQVQGEQAITDIVKAFEAINASSYGIEAVVLIRGGGSADDLAAFSTEQVTRAVAGSRIPTLVAIGHEIDVSLAERAADVHASTPSNAAEMLTPDKAHELKRLKHQADNLKLLLSSILKDKQQALSTAKKSLKDILAMKLTSAEDVLASKRKLLAALSPEGVLKRGYAIVKSEGRIIKSSKKLKKGQEITVQFSDGLVNSEVK